MSSQQVVNNLPRYSSKNNYVTLILDINQSNLNVKLRQKGLFSKMGAKSIKIITINITTQMKTLELQIAEFNNFKILAIKANEQYNATIKNGLVIITASIAFLQSLGY